MLQNVKNWRLGGTLGMRVEDGRIQRRVREESARETQKETKSGLIGQAQRHREPGRETGERGGGIEIWERLGADRRGKFWG